MKRLRLVLLTVMICVGCSIQSKPLQDNAYNRDLLGKYNEAKALQIYKGSFFEAKLMVMDRYIRDDQTMYYNYQIYIKPLANLDTEKLHIKMKLNKKQSAYYSGTENQTVFSTITYPVRLNVDENVACYEYQFHVSAATFQAVSQTDWEAMMKQITVALSWGSQTELLKFQMHDDINTYSGNDAAFVRSFGQIQ